MSFVLNAINQMNAASMRIDTGFNMMVNNQRRLALMNQASQQAIAFGSAGMPQQQLSQIHAQDKELELRNVRDSFMYKMYLKMEEKNQKEKEKKLDYMA